MCGKSLKKWLTRIGDLFAFAAGIGVVLLVMTIVIAVVGRYAFSQPIFGIEDVSRILLTFIVAGSIAYGARRGAHVHVDVISMKAGPKVLFVSDIIARLIGIAVVFLASYALFTKGLCGKACGYFTPNLSIPHLPFYIALSISMALYGLIMVVELFSGQPVEEHTPVEDGELF
ncbi:TRAP transporter small permease [Celeribacter halophilus]|uniref:TRAP transporter small permease n=1 Tax=Celeribacter halophilus TaxID=576117 RepID=UPI0026E20EA3|nr:TRAP transporter small permease [Celeribacter halophilus]MDO6725165.1 TRAP transporter small permease [Celeribacter halophilus]